MYCRVVVSHDGDDNVGDRVVAFNIVHEATFGDALGIFSLKAACFSFEYPSDRIA